MEFKFRAGEDRRSSFLTPSTSDGYFTTQALRAGYIGGELRRTDSLQSPMISAREALRRELEKERIREEIIAREILRKRELEEEVRRELAYEREIALRRQADRFSLAGPTLAALNSESQRVLLRPPGHGVRVVERLPILGRNDVGFVEKLPVQRLVEASESEIRQIPEVGKSQVVFLSKSISSPSLAGSKRKSTVEIACLPSPKKVQKEWSCALCQVSTTSEKGLNEHIEGKKHKTNEEKLRASKPESKSKGASTVTPKKKDKSEPAKKGVATNDQQKPQVGQSGEQQAQKKQKRLMLRCEHCKVKCNSELMFASHLSGKKHLACMQELGVGTEEGIGESESGRKIEGGRRMAKQHRVKQGREEAVVDGVSADGIAETTEAPTDEKTEKTETPIVDDTSCKTELKEEQESRLCE